MFAAQFNLLNVPVANFQSFRGCDSTARTLRYTDDQSFPNTEPWSDFVLFRIDERPNGDVVDSRLAGLVRILQRQDGLRKRCVVRLRVLQLENQGDCLLSNGLPGVYDKVFRRKQADYVVLYMKCIWEAAHLIHIPGTRFNYVNNTIDLVMFNHFWPKPPEADGDMQTDDDTARPEEYCRNGIARIDEDEEDEAAEDEKDEEVEDDEE